MCSERSHLGDTYSYLPHNVENNEDKKWMKEKINTVMDEYKPGVFPLKYNGIFTTHCRCV